MAKATAKKQKSVEETLWDSANKLRGSVEPSEYKHVVLGLIFLKFASDKYEKRRKELVAEDKEKYAEMVEFYTMKNVFYLPEISRWTYLIKNAKQDDIALKIDTALFTVEKNNPVLKGALPDNYYSRINLEVNKLAALLDTINNIDTLRDKENDIVGRVYEYFLSKFAIAEGKGKGEYYTPKSIVNLIAEMIEPYKGIIYDPCCGSGGMFVQSMKFVESHQGNKKDISVYGQEYTNTTYKLAKMNLAIRGISANLGEKASSTFSDDQHKDLKADYIMANPPFNQKDWRASDELLNDPRWNGYDVPPISNANYGWILNMASKLSVNGVAGFLLANGALGDSDTLSIRRQLIKNKIVETIVILPRDMFYSTDISVTLWILNNNKKARTIEQNGKIIKYRDRQNEILFMDLRRWGSEYEKKYIQLTENDIERVATNYHNWQRVGHEQTYRNIPEFCYAANIEEIENNGFSLIPSKYIEFIDRDSNIDFDTEMKRIQNEFQTLLAEEVESQKELINAFKGLGYEIKL
ncbi:MAG: class I SAM-dependent DNA methyltransferase [Pseudomonadota bacterium]